MLCPAGRTYDANHPTCRTCRIGCANKEADPTHRQPVDQSAPSTKGRSKGPNKTELEYQTRLGYEFPGCKIRFEGITLHLDNGHAYTPDLVVTLNDGDLLLVEVKARGKNNYRQPSYQRAKVMFDQSRLEYPQWRWRFAEKCRGEWEVKDFPCR